MSCGGAFTTTLEANQRQFRARAFRCWYAAPVIGMHRGEEVSLDKITMRRPVPALRSITLLDEMKSFSFIRHKNTYL